jgi:hypothetical protein
VVRKRAVTHDQILADAVRFGYAEWKKAASEGGVSGDLSF